MMDFVLTSIPDITDRFPEGFGGVDMTPGQDFSDRYNWGGYEPSCEEIMADEMADQVAADPGEEEAWNSLDRDQRGAYLFGEKQGIIPRFFQIGDEFPIVGIYGGMTTYIVKKIDRKNGRILLAERWTDLDGSGTRPAEWHKLVNEDGNEKALEYYSELLQQDCWIYANGNNY